MLFEETFAVYCENHTEQTDTVRTSQETHYLSATKPNWLMLFGEAVAVCCQSQVKVILRPTVSRPVRPGVRHPSGTRDQFFPNLFDYFLDSFGLVDVGRPLWREVGSVLFSFCRASPT
jgi:hypothetical protein